MLTAALLGSMPDGARYEERVEGFAFTFDAPWTQIRVRDRVTPLRSVRDVFAELRHGLQLSSSAAAPIEELVTTEGEHAAIADIVDGDRRCTFGIVYGDHFARVVVGRTAEPSLVPAITSAARALTLEHSLGLATLRRRRYRYTPPPGWNACTRHGLISEWFAPRFPSDRAMITVMPARPFKDTPASATERNIHEMVWGGYEKESMEGPSIVVVSEHLQGVAWKLVGTWLDRQRTLTDVVIVNDGTFQYLVRLDHDGSNADVHRDTLESLVRSIQPVPRARRAVETSREVAD